MRLMCRRSTLFSSAVLRKPGTRMYLSPGSPSSFLVGPVTTWRKNRKLGMYWHNQTFPLLISLSSLSWGHFEAFLFFVQWTPSCSVFSTVKDYSPWFYLCSVFGIGITSALAVGWRCSHWQVKNSEAPPTSVMHPLEVPLLSRKWFSKYTTGRGKDDIDTFWKLSSAVKASTFIY